MHFSEFLLKHFDTLFDGNDALNDVTAICFQIFVGPCEHIQILLEQLSERMIFCFRTTSSQVNEIGIFWSA
jgi:hypothetical protein